MTSQRATTQDCVGSGKWGIEMTFLHGGELTGRIEPPVVAIICWQTELCGALKATELGAHTCSHNQTPRKWGESEIV